MPRNKWARRHGRLDLGIWFVVEPIRRLMDHYAVTVYVGDPEGDHAKIDDETHASEEMAVSRGWKRVGEIVKLTDSANEVSA